MSLIPSLLEQRDAAHRAFADYADARKGHDLTPDEVTEAERLHAEARAADDAVIEAREDEKRAKAIDKARASITPKVKVTKEARTYGEGSPNSWVADFVRSSSPAWPGHAESVERLSRYGHEVAVEIANDSKEGRRARKLITESQRGSSPASTETLLRHLAELGRTEFRAGLTTGASSGGSFVTPVYDLTDYAPYRMPGRAFTDQAHKEPLPSYGMTINLPAISAPAAVGAQVGGEAGTLLENDPAAGYLTANLTTQAGQVTISQQLLDRAGPNFAFDRMCFDQLTRAYNQAVDTYVLTQALVGAGVISYTTTGTPEFALTTASTNGGFYSKVSGAKAAIRTGSGVVMEPTHIFLDPRRWEVIESWADAQGRPVVVPNYAGPYMAVGAGLASGAPEGDTGFKLNGLPVFTDLNIPTPGSGAGADQAIVASLNEVWVFEGDLVPRVLPQTLAANLNVLLQVYAYVGVIARYPLAVQAIRGNQMVTPAF